MKNDPLSWFMCRMAVDNRLDAHHLALYAALFHIGTGYPAGSFFPISRKSLLRHTGIRSQVTYHKRLAELVEYGYIHYLPSYNPATGSRVAFII